MNDVNQRSYIFDRCIGKDSMAKVEDMTRPTFNAIKDPFDFLFNQIHWTK
jgi:hypothetical protein